MAENQNHVASTIFKYLKLLKLSVSEAYLTYLINSHPDSPSLLSITDSLNRLGIEHTVGKINQNYFSELAYPYLLFSDKSQQEVAIIKSTEDFTSHYHSLNKWSGVVLKVDGVKKVNDNLNVKLFSSERFAYRCAMTVFFVIISFFALSLSYSLSWYQLTLFITSLIGLTTGYFLLSKELGINYESVDSFCKVGRKTDCDKVLKTDLRIGGMTMSDAVVIYFLFQLIALSQSTLQSNYLPYLGFLSMLTLPIILFSLYYQYVIVKVWCRLCLIVVFVLAGQLILFVTVYRASLSFANVSRLETLLPLSLLFVLLAAIIIILKEALHRTSHINQISIEGNKIKHEISVFSQLLSKQKKIESSLLDYEMVLGNRHAPIKLIMASNLFCKPCKEEHEFVEQLIRLYPDYVNVSIRFVAIQNAVGETRSVLQYLMNYWFRNIYNKPNETENTLLLLHDWYSEWNLEKFKGKYPPDFSDNLIVEEIERKQYEWVYKSEIEATPTFFVNGYQLPKDYSVEDVITMTPGLLELFRDNQIPGNVGVELESSSSGN